MTAAYAHKKITSITPLYDTILVKDMEFNERVSHGGIVLLKDDMKSSGIRPRWAKVYAVGPTQQDVKVGQYICIEHGRWTRGINLEDETGKFTIRKVDANAIMLVSDAPVDDATMSDAV